MTKSFKIEGIEGEGGVGMAGLWGSVAGAYVLSATGLDLRLTDGALGVRHEDALIWGVLGWSQGTLTSPTVMTPLQTCTSRRHSHPLMNSNPS